MISASETRRRTVKGKCIHWISRCAYSYADSIIGISGGVSRDVSKVLGLPSKKVVTIHNPAFNNQILEMSKSAVNDFPSDQSLILGVGSLTNQKDFATLIRAFELVRQRIKSHLLILGEGRERKKLERLVQELELNDHVSMPGFVNNPFSYMATADVFVLSSRWEGFGNVLVEAMGCGTQVVSTDCPSGPAEILENGKWGRLVPVGDEEAMAHAIIKTLRDAYIDEKKLKKRASDFAPAKIADQYLEIMRDGA